MPISILIADDHALLRQGIKNVLDLEPDFRVIGEASDGEEAIKLALELQPDIMLLDVNMPKHNGIEVTKAVSDKISATKIVILTMHDDETYVIELIKSGAAGYLLKDIEPSLLIKAIRVVNQGESFIYPTLAKKLLGELSRKSEEKKWDYDHMPPRNEERLTFREVEVLQLIAQGLSNQEVAKKLFLSEKTVKNHLTNIFRKINVTDRTQAVLYALKHKIVALN